MYTMDVEKLLVVKNIEFMSVMLSHESLIYAKLTSKFIVDQVISAHGRKGGSAPRSYCRDL